jgi:hypothetical protein
MRASDAPWIAAARLFLDAAITPAAGFDAAALRSLENVTLDWPSLARSLCGNGLARPLLGTLGNPQLKGIVPASFVETLCGCGLYEAVRERGQRDTIGRISDALHELRGTGVLLKGGAFLMRTLPLTVPRATADIDLLVTRDLAPRLRRLLLAHGFEGERDPGAGTYHHQDRISCGGVPLEIHTHIMPPFWGLPEAEMLADLRAVLGADTLFTLGPSALVLHALVHTTASFFSFGLKTAWDLLAVLTSEPAFDWSRLQSLASGVRVQRAFWTPLKALSGILVLPVPTDFLARAPIDRGSRRVDELARQRILSTTDNPGAVDFAAKTRFMLRLIDSWPGRLGYLATVGAWHVTRPATLAAGVRRARNAGRL